MLRELTALSLFFSALALGSGAAVAEDLFTDTFLPKFKEACVGSAKVEVAGKVSDDKVAAYCNCAATRMSQNFSDAEKQRSPSAAVIRVSGSAG
jgi:hypothetical protein